MPQSTKPAPEGEHNEGATYSAKQIATRIGTDARSLRKFFRSPQSEFVPVGRGGRYEYPVEDLDSIKVEFWEWKRQNDARAAQSKFRKKSSGPAPVEEDEMEEFDDEEDE